MSKSRFIPPDVKQTGEEDAAMPYMQEEESSPVSAIKQRHEARLMAIDGVEGVGIGQDAIGGSAIVVYARDRQVAERLPRELDGIPVQVVVTGPIEAL